MLSTLERMTRTGCTHGLRYRRGNEVATPSRFLSRVDQMPVGWCRTTAMMFDGCMTMACGETPCGAISRAVLQLLPPSRENARNNGPPDRIMATTVSPGAPNPTRTGFGTTTSEASSKPLQTPFTSQSLLWSSSFVALTGSHATVLKYLPIGVRS